MCAYVFLVCICISDRNEFQLKCNPLFAIWSLSPQRFHYYFYLGIVSWQYEKYSTIRILVLCLLCVTPLVCSSYSSFARLHLSSAADDNKNVRHLHIHLFSKVLHRRRRVSPRQTIYLLRVGFVLLCHALRICVAHATTESCPFSLHVH